MGTVVLPLEAELVTGNGPANGKGHGGPARGYVWPPFTPGHEMSKVHGAYSERSVAPLAEQIASSLLEDAGAPAYLREPGYVPVIAAWSRSEAVVSLLWSYLSGLDAEQSLTERIEGTETEDHGEGGRVSRKSSSKRVMSVLGELHRAETRAMNLRSRLGLDPASRARILRDLGIAHQTGGDAIAKLQETGREIRERREAELKVTGGGGDDRSA
jgi:hypothetical protein